MRFRIRRRARALREPFGTAGLLVAIVALVFAMTGGAFAAKYIITSTKQIKPSVLKQLKGKKGPRGEKGAPGADGTNGTNGTNGAKGAKGDQGIAGTSAGLQVAEATATNVTGFTTPEAETPVALAGTTSFVPKTGRSYLLLAELRGNPIDADGVNTGTGTYGCYARVHISVNGVSSGLGLGISADANESPSVHPAGTSSFAVALQQAGVPQIISASASESGGAIPGSSGCGAGTTGNLRIVVIEFG